MNLIVMEDYWIGASFRTTNLLVLNAGVEILDRVRLAYSYDFASSNHETENYGVSHELSLSFVIE